MIKVLSIISLVFFCHKSMALSLSLVKNADVQVFTGYSAGKLSKEVFDLKGLAGGDDSWMHGYNLGTQLGFSFLGASAGIQSQYNYFFTEWFNLDDDKVKFKQLLVGFYAGYKLPILASAWISYFPEVKIKTDLNSNTEYTGRVWELGARMHNLPFFALHFSISRHFYNDSESFLLYSLGLSLDIL